MLGEIALERACLERTYDGVMTVTGSQKQVREGETVVTQDAVLYQGVPCGLALSGAPVTAQDGTAGEIRYSAVLFCAPELRLPPGCRITVEQYGKETHFRYSGECARLPTHQELSIQREDRA